jgi:hypothetical protein
LTCLFWIRVKIIDAIVARFANHAKTAC